jgi:hypothetical protein
MKKLIKGLGLGLALALALGGAGSAGAALTMNATSVTSGAALTLDGAAGSNVVLGGATVAGTITIGVANTGGINVGTGDTIKTISIGTGNAVNTIAIGSHATPVNVITLGGAASTLTVGATLLGASPLVFEASTANAHELTFAVADVTADRTVTFPDASGTVTLNSISAQAATATLGVADLYGATVTNTGASGAVVLTLPAPAVGMEFTVWLTVAQDVDINPADGTTILALTNASGDAISSAATIGNMITLRALSTTTWGAVSVSGTWTDAN